MPTHDKKVWFRAKRYGWGWGLPCSWQGWVVMVGYISLMIAGAFVWGGEKDGFWFWIGYVMGLTALLIVICAVKGKKPRWRWGIDYLSLRQTGFLQGGDGLIGYFTADLIQFFAE